jgi:hypothetical protein
MRVVNARDGVLTNLEVKELLEEQLAARLREEQALPLPGARRGQSGPSAWQSRQNAAIISEQVLGHLDTIACSTQTRERISTFMQAAEEFRLTRAETLAIVNMQPSSVVDIHLLVEECEERLSDDDVRRLLSFCRTLSTEQEAEGS